MRWKYEDDMTKAVLTASAHVESRHGDANAVAEAIQKLELKTV